MRRLTAENARMAKWVRARTPDTGQPYEFTTNIASVLA
jgi:hypothetical protein